MDEQEAETTVYHALEIKDLSIIADIKATNPGFSTHTHIKEQTLTEKWPLNLKGCLGIYPRKCRYFRHFRGFSLLYELDYDGRRAAFSCLLSGGWNYGL